MELVNNLLNPILFSGNELDLVNCFQDFEYVSALISADKTYIGIKPDYIIEDWDELVNFNIPEPSYLAGYIGYEQGYQFIDPPPGSVLKTNKQDSVILPNIHFAVISHYVEFDKNKQLINIVSPDKKIRALLNKTIAQPQIGRAHV